MPRFGAERRQCVPPLSAAVLAQQGVSAHMLRGPGWRQAGRGSHVPADTVRTPAQRIVEAGAKLPPGAAIGGWAAAYAQGADLLDGFGGGRRPWPVTIVTPPTLHRISTAGLRYVRETLPEQDLISTWGLRFTSPARTAIDLARWASDLTEAVVALDALLAAGVISGPDLVTAGARAQHNRGVRQARQAMVLARTGVRSPGETRLRMLYVLELSAPDPLVNCPVYDDSGRLLGIPDLLDVEAGLALEYDGDSWTDRARPKGHRDHDQHREDNAREEQFERTRLIVVRAGRADLGRHRAQLRFRLREARVDGLARDRTRDRWQLER